MAKMLQRKSDEPLGRFFTGSCFCCCLPGPGLATASDGPLGSITRVAMMLNDVNRRANSPKRE